MTLPDAKDTRLPALDLLRFTAAIAVTLYHYVTCYPSMQDAAGTTLSAVSAVTRYGYLGVDLFFMISGFVILWSSMNRSALGFVVSRISRLYPTFWVSLIFTVGCILLLGGAVASYVAPPLDLWTLAANATMLPAPLNAPLIEGVYWTLEIEIRFYALIFLLLLMRQMHHVEAWLYAWLLVSIAALIVKLPWVIHYVALIPYAPFFIAGCLFYLVLSKGMTASRGTALTICAVVCAYTSVSQRSGFITADSVSGVIVPSLILLFFGLFAALILRRQTSPASRFAYWAGALTYPLYLIHATMGGLAYELLRPTLGVAVTLLAITTIALIIAWIITVTVDIPARKPLSELLYRCARALRLYKPTPRASLP